MAEVEPDARKASFEVETEAVERSCQLSPAPLEHLQRLGPPAQAIQHVGNAVEAVVETEPRRPAWMQCPLDEPVLVRRISAAIHRVQAVEHTCRPVGQVQCAGEELHRVTREQTVVPFGRGAREDGSRHRGCSAAPTACCGLEQGRRCRSRGGFRRWDIAGYPAHRLVQERSRHAEPIGDGRCQFRGLGGPQGQEMSEGHEQVQAQAGERVAVGVDARAAGRRREGRVGQDLPPGLPGVGGALEVDERDPPVGADDEV